MSTTCEQNILQQPLDSSFPANDDVLLFTKSNGASVIRTWATIQTASSPNDIEFSVGDVGMPQDGDATYQSNVLIGKRVRVYRNGTKQSAVANSSFTYYSFNNVTGVITFFGNLTLGEIIQIEIY